MINPKNISTNLEFSTTCKPWIIYAAALFVENYKKTTFLKSFNIFYTTVRKLVQGLKFEKIEFSRDLPGTFILSILGEKFLSVLIFHKIPFDLESYKTLTKWGYFDR